MIDPSVTAFFAANPGVRLAVLGWGSNLAHLDLRPLGIPAEPLDAEAHPKLIERYHAANVAKFPGPLALPGWVLVDLYLLPSALALLLDEEGEIVAAWCGVPTLEPGLVMGVSLLCLREGVGAAYVVKRLGLSMMRARRQRGVTQWKNRSIRTHSRIGALRVLGPAPDLHGEGLGSFVYELELDSPPLLHLPPAERGGGREGGRIPPSSPPSRGRRGRATEEPLRIAPSEGPLWAGRAAAGERVFIVPPGIDEAGRVLLRVAP